MKYCTNCGNEGEGKHRGSFAVTLFWLIFFFPIALIYDHRRQAGGKCVCTSCGKESLIPADSPMAKRLRGGA